MFWKILRFYFGNNSFGEERFLFQHDNTSVPVHKARSIRTWISQFGLEELNWSAMCSDPIHHLWDYLQASLFCQSSLASDLTKAT